MRSPKEAIGWLVGFAAALRAGTRTAWLGCAALAVFLGALSSLDAPLWSQGGTAPPVGMVHGPKGARAPLANLHPQTGMPVLGAPLLRPNPPLPVHGSPLAGAAPGQGAGSRKGLGTPP